MRKMTTAILALLLILLCACGAEAPEPTAAAPAEEVQAVQPTSAEPAPEPEDEPASAVPEDEPEAAAPEDEPEAVIPDEERPLRIAVASDLHYLSQRLTDNGPLFAAVTEAGDGKQMLEIEAITEAFTEQMIAEKPDILILSGDLSYNGERESHVDLAQKLERIRQAGVRVLVIPGNHDLNNRRAIRFEGAGYERTESVDAQEFMEIYRDFGYADVLSFDERSNSYVCEASEDLRILMLDTNSRVTNALPAESLSWLEEQLLQAKEAGIRVITSSHQNVMLHNTLFSSGYQITNGPQILSICRKNGVLANLSGHMHIQHMLSGEVPEVLTGALSLPPFRYGLLLWDGESLSYEARCVDVSAWAEAQGLDDEKWLDFDEYARECFFEHFYRQGLESLEESDLAPDDAERFARCFAELNCAFFAGEQIDREAFGQILDDWAQLQGESFHTVYLRSILLDDAPDPLKILLRAAESG